MCFTLLATSYSVFTAARASLALIVVKGRKMTCLLSCVPRDVLGGCPTSVIWEAVWQPRSENFDVCSQCCRAPGMMWQWCDHCYLCVNHPSQCKHTVLLAVCTLMRGHHYLLQRNLNNPLLARRSLRQSASGVQKKRSGWLCFSFLRLPLLRMAEISSKLRGTLLW